MKRSKGLCLATCMMLALPSYAKQTVYESDNFIFAIGGDFEIQYRQRAEPGDDAELEYDDVELHFFADYLISDSTTVFSRVDLDFRGEIDNDDSVDVLDKAFLGIAWENFSIGFGKNDYVTDDYSPDFDYEMGGNDAFPADGGDDLIFADAEFGNLLVRASYDLPEGDDDEAEDEESIDLIAVYDFGDWEVGVAHQNYTPSQTIDEETGLLTEQDDISTSGIYATGTIGNFKTIFGVSDSDEGSWVQLAGKYALSEKWAVAGGYEFFSGDGDDASDIDVYYANLTYSLNPKVKLFAEIGSEDIEDGDDEFGWLAGIQVRF